LDICNTSISDHGAKQIGIHGGKIERLYFVNTRISNNGIKEMALGLKNLQCVHTNAELRDDGLIFLAMHCPKLEGISAKNCKLTDESLRYVSKYCSNLKWLDVTNTEITSSGVRFIKKGCKKLEIMMFLGTRADGRGFGPSYVVVKR